MHERRVLIGTIVVGVALAAGVGAMTSDGLQRFDVFGARVEAAERTKVAALASTPSHEPTRRDSEDEGGASSSPATASVPLSLPVGAEPTESEDSAPWLPTHAQIEAWIAALRDDDERGNANYARRELRECGPAATIGLAHALESDDRQQRFYAAELLVDRGDPLPSRIFDVAVEGLADDDLFDSNAQWSLRFLDAHPTDAAERLTLALFSSDRQQRFLAAYLLARTGAEATRAQACSVLIEHLADNDTQYDAELARDALTQLSYFVLPQIEHATRAATDRQARLYLEGIQMDIVRRAPFARPGQSAWLGTNSPLPFNWIVGEY